jgi:hypothetical protein
MCLEAMAGLLRWKLRLCDDESLQSLPVYIHSYHPSCMRDLIALFFYPFSLGKRPEGGELLGANLDLLLDSDLAATVLNGKKTPASYLPSSYLGVSSGVMAR